MAIAPRGLDAANRVLSDLSSVRQFATREWGGELAAMYTDSLIELIDLLPNYPEFGFRAIADRPEVYETGAGQHIVYYLVHESHIQVLRVLHDSVDPDHNLL